MRGVAKFVPLQAMVVMELLEGGDQLDCLRRMQQQRLVHGGTS